MLNGSKVTQSFGGEIYNLRSIKAVGAEQQRGRYLHHKDVHVLYVHVPSVHVPSVHLLSVHVPSHSFTLTTEKRKMGIKHKSEVSLSRRV